MNEVSVFVGGSVGKDPYSPSTWSGISVYLLRAMEDAGLLDKAVGIDVPSPVKAWLMAKNYSRDRSVWRTEFYFDPAYRDALTRAAARVPLSSPICLQVGAMFSLPKAFPAHPCVSMNDGCLAELQKSEYSLRGVSAKRIDQALRYEEETAQSLSGIFTFSEYLCKAFVRDYHVPAERVFNVGGAVNLDEFPAFNPEKSYDAPRVLFIGTEFARKGGKHLLEAFQIVRQSMPSAELHIVGPHQLESIPAGVVFHGRLSKADPAQKLKLERLFRESTLFVLPSLYEPFGIAPLEAMLYQMPCLVTDAWALRETVTPGVNGDLVELGSAEDLACKMKRLLSDPDGLARMGAKGRELVLERYTWPAVVGRMAAALKTVC